VPAQLVHDLARRLAGLRVGLRALPGGQDAQCAGGEAGAERQEHPRRPDAVPAEQREKPRDAGSEVRLAAVAEPQRLQIVQRPMDQAGQPAVVAPHRRPGPLRRPVRRDRDRTGVLDAQVPAQHRPIARGQVHLPPQPARGIGLRGMPGGRDRDPVAGPAERRPAHALGRHRPAAVAGPDRLDGREIDGELEGHDGRHRHGRGRRDGDLLRDPARGDAADPVDPDGRIPGRAQPTGQGDEPIGARARGGVADRLRLPVVEAEHGRGEHAGVGVEGALHADRPDLPVGAAQHRGRRGHGRHQVVQ
jgi:hypothetical protein